MRNKYVFEFQVKFQVLYTFNLLDVHHFKFNDKDKSLILSFGDSDCYYLDMAAYDELKQKLLSLSKTLDCVCNEDRYIFLDHVSGLAMDNRGYYAKFKFVSGVLSITKTNYYLILNKMTA